MKSGVAMRLVLLLVPLQLLLPPFAALAFSLPLPLKFVSGCDEPTLLVVPCTRQPRCRRKNEVRGHDKTPTQKT